jgi:hypothetical protein
MQKPFSKTPFIAAFFCALSLSACEKSADVSDSVSDLVSVSDYARCSIPTTAIASIQGTRPSSGMVDQRVTVQGVTTLIETGHGLYIEEPDSDHDPVVVDLRLRQSNTSD